MKLSLTRSRVLLFQVEGLVLGAPNSVRDLGAADVRLDLGMLKQMKVLVCLSETFSFNPGSEAQSMRALV